MVMATVLLSSRIDKSAVCGPQAHDDPHLSATSGTAGDNWCRGDDTRGLETDGVCLHAHQAEGVGRDGTAGMHQAAVADFHAAIREDVLEDPADTLKSVEVGGAWACTLGFTIGEGDGAILKRDAAAVGYRHFADRGGEVLAGRVAVWIGPTVDVPGDSPALWGDLL
jgi:hypothetical protein